MDEVQALQALRLANLPGAEDYWFDWIMTTGQLVYQRKPDGLRQELANGVADKPTAMMVATIFARGLSEAATVRMVKWPQEKDASHVAG